MDVKTNSKSRLSSRHVTEGAEPGGRRAAEVFKKTPYIADLKPGGRDVAKDLFESGDVPLLTKTLLEAGYLHADCSTVAGREIAETVKGAKRNPDLDVVRPASKSITAIVGLKGCLMSAGATAEKVSHADQ